jgi:hypothetical protein
VDETKRIATPYALVLRRMIVSVGRRAPSQFFLEMGGCLPSRKDESLILDAVQDPSNLPVYAARMDLLPFTTIAAVVSRYAGMGLHEQATALLSASSGVKMWPDETLMALVNHPALKVVTASSSSSSSSSSRVSLLPPGKVAWRLPSRVKTEHEASASASSSAMEVDMTILADLPPLMPDVFFRTGALSVCCLGRICLRPAFHTKKHLFPVGYLAFRLGFSYRPGESYTRVLYAMEILDDGQDDGPLCRITASDDIARPITARSPTAAWRLWLQRHESDVVVPTSSTSSSSSSSSSSSAAAQLAMPAASTLAARINRRRVFPNGDTNAFGLTGPTWFGVGLPSVQRLLERLPFATACERYECRFVDASERTALAQRDADTMREARESGHDMHVLPKVKPVVASRASQKPVPVLPINASGSARAEGHVRQSYQDKELFLATVHRVTDLAETWRANTMPSTHSSSVPMSMKGSAVGGRVERRGA